MGALMRAVVLAVQRASPAVLASAAKYVSTSSGVLVRTGSELVQWAKRSPASAALVATALAQAGMAIAELFDETTKAEIQADPDGARLVRTLNGIEAKVTATLDAGADVKLGGPEHDGELEFLKELIIYFRRRYGARGAELTQLHLMMRAFVEIDSATLARGIRLFGNA